MDDKPEPGKLHQWFTGAEGDEGPDMDLRDYLWLLDLSLDIDAQLRAVHGLLNRTRDAADDTAKEIKEIEEYAKTVSGRLNRRAVDDWVDHLHHSVYQDAAHSMAAVGMLAPFLESLFAQCFHALGRKFFPPSEPVGAHSRWSSAHVVRWDCHVVVRNGEVRTDLVSGIMQLTEACSLNSRFPLDLKQTLSALFGYRNKMFHLGFEWPMAERVAFGKRVTDEHWPKNWFSCATQGNEPWIYYMSPAFVDHVVATVYGVLDGFATYIRDDLLPKHQQRLNAEEQKENCPPQQKPIS